MNFNIDINSDRTNETTPLCSIMTRFGSDKGNNYPLGHNYTKYYYQLFKDIRNEKLRVFELGLGTNNVNLPSNMGAHGIPGASLRGWKDFFPNSLIYGADIDKNILFEEERIKTFFCDQRSPEIIGDMWNNNSELTDNFDIILDDGLHTFTANMIFFENSIHKLNVGGVFIIEDILRAELSLFENKLSEFKNKYPNLRFRLYVIPHENTNDNTVLIAQKISN